MDSKTLVYLASPYSHQNPEIESKRYHAVMRAAVRMLGEGVPVFAPIVYSHPMVPYANFIWDGEGENGLFDKRSDFDYRMIDACDVLCVLMLDGWEESVGVSAEIEYAQKAGKFIEYIHEQE